MPCGGGSAKGGGPAGGRRVIGAKDGAVGIAAALIAQRLAAIAAEGRGRNFRMDLAIHIVPLYLDPPAEGGVLPGPGAGLTGNL